MAELSDDATEAPDTMMGKLVVIDLVREDGTLRYFSGYVFEFSLLGSKPVLVDIPSITGYRIPTGNEFGANGGWRPGGLPESTISPVSPEFYTVGPVFP